MRSDYEVAAGKFAIIVAVFYQDIIKAANEVVEKCAAMESMPEGVADALNNLQHLINTENIILTPKTIML